MSVDRRWRRGGVGPRSGDRGQSTIEFALVLPVVALLVIGVIELARVSGLQVATVDAARAGARAASVDPRPGVAQAAIGAGAAEGSWAVTTAITGGSPRLVTVHVSREVHLLPVLDWTEVHLEASSTMAVEPAD